VITGTIVEPWFVFQTDYFKAFAFSSIFGIYYPSGNSTPSDADIQLTRKLRDTGRFWEISVLVHLIILPEGYVSCQMKE
jgi:DNA repair protein RadC